MRKVKILYVDDEAINLMLFQANLEKKYHVLTAENAFTGLQYIAEDKYIKIVVTDMKMPVMNGMEFIRKARLIAPEIAYFILTGFEICDEIQEALSQGIIRRYFRKPFNIQEISREIEDTIAEFSDGCDEKNAN
ncbi:MAG: response regulator [Paludibacter sp.]|nr:response regulator [Paludibacter sp.]MDD4198337.1 response regulator [Paludibacter sp.]MDD4428078.1 response regulator [Paludibacter sp.]